MKTIEQVLPARSRVRQTSDIHIRYNPAAGDVGYLIYLHGQLYARGNQGYNLEFEGLCL